MIRTLTYPENSTDEMLRESGFGDSRPTVEDDRDLLTSGLLGKELISFCAVVNSCLLYTSELPTNREV